MGQLVVIDDYSSVPLPPPGKSMGCVPRDWATMPYGSLMHAKPFDLPLIPRSQWQGLMDKQKANKEQLSEIRNTGMYGGVIPSRDQDGKGYCWAHSSVSAALIVRAINNQPYEDLSAFSVACPIKNFRDEGGWGAESLEWIAVNGIATSKTWPQQSMSRSNWNDTTKAEMQLYRFEEWMDLDPNQMEEQMMTCLLMGIPVVSDFNWWSHSVCTINAEDLTTTRIWNSWGDSWSENGTGLLKGSRRIPDAAIAPRVIRAAA